MSKSKAGQTGMSVELPDPYQEKIKIFCPDFRFFPLIYTREG